MGNTASNANNPHPSPSIKRVDSPSSRSSSHQQSQSPSPTPSQPHRSLRTKKRSLELPDLASLSLSPYNSANTSPHSRRPPQTSSPIPIPIPNNGQNGQINNATNTGTSPRGRQMHPQPYIPRNNDSNLSTELLDQPSTHIPVRRGHYIRGTHYSSTYSIQSRGSANPRMQELYVASQQEPEPPAQDEFVQEVVQSTIPLVLPKSDDDPTALQSPFDIDENGQLISRPGDTPEEPREPISVKIIWRGGGKNVVLARAGDDNWKGRQPMRRSDSQDDHSWSTYVSLMPGTHHIRFIVDNQWRLAEDLPTAVDDEGSLANYVAVPISGLTPPSGGAAAAQPPPAQYPTSAAKYLSFWSESSAMGTEVFTLTDPESYKSGWTDEIPPELVIAAREEEAYLAYTSGTDYELGTHDHVPAPNIPPAPALPRHLDKLILNSKASGGRGRDGRDRQRERDRDRDRDRDREHRRRQGRSMLGMASSIAGDVLREDTIAGSETKPIPITTASGADVTFQHLSAAQISAQTPLGLEGPGLSDDASVLPVPSHVVLHHLSTSAIRNGVLAVGTTTRYRKKFLTTIYYKPT